MIKPWEIHGNSVPTLTVDSQGHALHVFINGQLSGTTPISIVMYIELRFKFVLWICYWIVRNLYANSSGSAFGNPENKNVKFTGNANLHAGINKISLLSVAVGLQVSRFNSNFILSSSIELHESKYDNSFWSKNNGPHFELWKTGVLGPVVLHGVDRGSRDISRQKWSYKVYFVR